VPRGPPCWPVGRPGAFSENLRRREIAEHLVLSHRTVDYHLRNIFTRLGIRSRVELTAGDRPLVTTPDNAENASMNCGSRLFALAGATCRE
jgi:Bacterial regulatory proteins, luxR family